MFRRLLSLSLLVVGTGSGGSIAAEPPLSTQAIAVAETLRDRVLADNQAWNIVESLTTEIGPRMAGSAADARAVAWAKRLFEQLGYDRVTLEPVTFTAWRRNYQRAEIVGPFPQALTAAALGGSIGTGGKPLQAEVVEFATLEDLEKSPAGSAQGKIAYISNRMERAQDGHGYGPAVKARGQGAVMAAQKGAVALLIRSIGTDNDRLPHAGMMKYADGTKQIPALALSNPDADQLSRIIKRGVSVQIKLDVDAGPAGEYTSYNVIGDVIGREAPEQMVIIGGHLDSWDLGTGAIDDGAGIAITMAAGAAIAKLDARPRRTVRVIAWANEENGLLGARAYAAAHADRIANHLIGAESDFGAGRIYALRAKVTEPLKPAIEQIAVVLKPLGIEFDGNGGGDAGPDIGPLAERGMSWVSLAQDGTHYFDYHHTANDTLDKINRKDLDQQVAAYAVLAYLAAESRGISAEMPRK